MNGKKARMIRNIIGNPYEKKFEKDPRDQTKFRTTCLIEGTGRQIYRKYKKWYTMTPMAKRIT